MKSYTDIEQSKKLAEILPLESADMYYDGFGRLPHGYAYPLISPNSFEYDKPCWSLAALLRQLKSEIILENKQILFLHLNKYNDISHEIRYTNSWSGEALITKENDPIDACYEMIIRLHELNLL